MKMKSGWLALALCAGLSPLVAAQGYPSKPIRMIAPSGAGGPVDVICRAVAQAMSETLGHQVIVENRVGAAGLIGTEFVVKQPADGYTLLFGFSGPLAIVPHLNPNTPYDPLRDLAPVSQVASAPYVLLVHPSVPAKTAKELAALAASRPGKMNFGSGGNGVGIHMAGELFKLAAGVQIVHVPFKGAAPAMTALLSGEIDMMFNALPPALPYIKAGRVRALAIGSETRSEIFPSLPTLKEAGLDFSVEGWYGVLGPRDTPKAIVDVLHRTLVQSLQSQQYKAQMAKMMADTMATSPSEFAAMLREEHAKWGKVIKAAGIKM
jgi:tripartite-type tricarboxylate transporter receptor subunit TctC